mmetsp:Transcript_11325/g.20936  ORF Transcript_11325/g.20936 Transcript_11325/m.20936 type:complete len:304 (-) Transcript_11325:255-1166(-)
MKQQRCEAKVTDPHIRAVCEKNVSQLQITMNDLFVLEIFYPVEKLKQNSSGLLLRESFLSFYELHQSLIVTVFKQNVDVLAIFKVMFESHDIFVRERSVYFDLAEQLSPCSILFQRRLFYALSCANMSIRQVPKQVALCKATLAKESAFKILGSGFLVEYFFFIYFKLFLVSGSCSFVCVCTLRSRQNVQVGHFRGQLFRRPMGGRRDRLFVAQSPSGMGFCFAVHLARRRPRGFWFKLRSSSRIVSYRIVSSRHVSSQFVSPNYLQIPGFNLNHAAPYSTPRLLFTRMASRPAGRQAGRRTD